MLSPTDRKLLGALLSRQEEAGASAELPPERVAEIAAGSPPSPDEATALLVSPLAREELVLHRRLRHLRGAVSPGGPQPVRGSWQGRPVLGPPVPRSADSDPSVRRPSMPADTPFGVADHPPDVNDTMPLTREPAAVRPLVRGGPPPPSGPGARLAGPPHEGSQPPRPPTAPTDAGPPAAGTAADNLLLPRGATPARVEEEAKPAGAAGWARLLSRLWARLRRRGPDPASGQGAGRIGGKPLRFEGPWASLRVEPGAGGAPDSLTLRLRPEVPGGPVGRAVEVREPQPDGLVWLAGYTDGAGVIRVAWAHAGLKPQDRPFASGLRIHGIEAGRN